MGNLQQKPQTDFGAKKSKQTKPKRKKKPKGKCKTYLEQKIALNLAEYKKGNYISRQQAIAVAYKQVKNEHPHCKRFLEKNK